MRVGFFLALPLLLASCTLNTDYFSEYRGVNILGNYDFNAQKDDGTGAQWATTTAGKNVVTAVAGTDYYMTWEPSGLSGLGLDLGPDGISPAYRLEIKNLIPDGDFETVLSATASTSLPASLTTIGWATQSGIPQFTLATSFSNNGQSPAVALGTGTGTQNHLDHRSLLFSSFGTGGELALDLSVALGTSNSTDNLWLPGQYRLRFDYINVGSSKLLGFHLIDANAKVLTTWSKSLKNDVTEPIPLASSQTITVEKSTDVSRFAIGKFDATSSDAAIIDNLRLIPEDTVLAAKASFPSLKSGKLQLLPGTLRGDYVFTVQVHDDPTADQTGASGIAHTPNRLYPSGLTVTIRGRAKNSASAILIQEFVQRPAAGWTAWTTLSFEGGLDFVSDDSALENSPALEILLTPTNTVDETTEDKDAGSLLVAQPTLTFNP